MSTTLPTATLGRTGLEVTRLGYGAMEIRDAPRGRPVTGEQAETVLNAVLDAGVTFIDTSNDYGRSEEFIGRYISQRRSEYYLATKCGCRPGGGPHIWTRDNLFRGLEESLQRLKTDHVDLMQLHNPTVQECEDGELVEGLQEMQRQGKVRHIGISTTVPHLPTYTGLGVFDAFQIPYSALQREHEDWIAHASDAGIGTIIRGGVAKGEPGPGVGRDDVWGKFGEAGLDDLRADDESPTSFILRYTLAHPQIDTTIVGTMQTDHLDENLRAVVRGPLPPDVYAETKRRLDGVGLSPEPVG